MSRRKSKRVNPTHANSNFRSNLPVSRFDVVERFYINTLTRWSLARFEWENLPETIDPRFLESALHHEGMLVFYYDDRFARFLAVRATTNGNINVYDNPTQFVTINRASYSSVRLSSKDCVPIWNNDMRTTSQELVYVYARRLADLDVSLDINARTMRHNKIVTCEDSQRLTYMNLLRKVDEGQPVIFGTDTLDLNALNVLDVSTNPDNMEALRLEKNQVWNECMTMLGITNANTDKKERLVSDEATASNGQVIIARNAAIKSRKLACEQINNMFGLNINVRWSLDPDIIPDFDNISGNDPMSNISDEGAM